MPSNLTRQIRNFYSAAQRSGCEAAAHIPAIVAGIDRCGHLRDPQPRSHVTDESHLARALSLGRGHGHDPLLDAISGCREKLVWNTAEGAYDDRPEYRHFLDNYAFTILTGPVLHGLLRLYEDSNLLCGLTIQAPGVHYPDHAHEAVEIYAVVGGTARWRRGEEDWTPRPPGSVILHESRVAHAMETGDEPTLALFARVSDLESRP